jgi:DNA-binding response OmpR family regulator
MYFIYVSNDQKAVELMQEVLLLVDHTTVLNTVRDGYDLIQLLQNIKRGETYPDLIILTKKLSRLSGKELLELLKSDDIYRLIPVIMLLPEANEEDEFFCRRMGADSIISPILKKDWVEAAKKICSTCA